MARAGWLVFPLTLAAWGGAWASEQEYTFHAAERRDPFTFQRMAQPPPPPPRRGEELPPLDYRQLSLLLEDRPEEALAQVELMLGKLPEGEEYQERRLEILRMQCVAERAVLRRETEEAFRALDLRLTGVVVRPGQALAILEGKVRRAGESLARQGPLAEASIASITPGRVVVRFRGLELPLYVQAR